MAEDSLTSHYHKPSSKFAAEAQNPFRPGKQYKVFELLRLGYTRAELIVEVESQIESRDHRALLDTVLHRTKQRGIDVIGGTGGEPFRLLPGEGYEAVRQASARPGPSVGETPATAGSQPEAGGQGSRTGAAERPAIGDELRPPAISADEVTIEDITDLYRRERRGQ